MSDTQWHIAMILVIDDWYHRYLITYILSFWLQYTILPILKWHVFNGLIKYSLSFFFSSSAVTLFFCFLCFIITHILLTCGLPMILDESPVTAFLIRTWTTLAANTCKLILYLYFLSFLTFISHFSVLYFSTVQF